MKSFLSIYYISKYFGCNLYALPRELNSSNFKASIRAVDILILLIHLFLSLFVMIPFCVKVQDVDSMYNKEFLKQVKSTGVIIITMIGGSMNFVTVFINLFIMIMDMINSSTIRSILLSFINFDENVKRHGVKISFTYKQTSLLLIFIFLFDHLMTAALGLNLQKVQDGKLFFIFELYVGNAMVDGCTCSFLLTYLYFMENLADRFRIINNCLRKYSNRETKVMDAVKGPLIDHIEIKCSNDFDLIRNLSKAYQSLVDIIPRINSCYSLQFVFCLFVLFTLSVINTYMFYEGLKYPAENELNLIAVFFICRAIYCNLAIYKIISVGSKIKQERKLSQSLVNKAISLSQNKVFSAKLNHLRHQIGHSNVDITCGLFSVDWTLLYTLSSAVGSYLLLFIQFDSINKKLLN